MNADTQPTTADDGFKPVKRRGRGRPRKYKTDDERYLAQVQASKRYKARNADAYKAYQKKYQKAYYAKKKLAKQLAKLAEQRAKPKPALPDRTFEPLHPVAKRKTKYPDDNNE
jgi:hypothetical protein